MKDCLLEIDIELVSASRYQPRSTFDEGELEDLARSIKAVGLIHPPVVRPVGETGRYELIAGERRFRAAIRAGLTKIPVMVRHSGEMLSAEQTVVENIQRVDLNPIEIAKALKRLADEFSYGQEELAQRLGKKRSTVANYLRLLALPEEIQSSLSGQTVSMGHAKVILSLDDERLQLRLHRLIVERTLTVRQAEEQLVSLRRPDAKKERRDLHVEDLERRLERRFGTQVKVVPRGAGGALTFTYFDLDDLDRLLEEFGLT